ncbi:MAG TPA: ketohydroxyglutarate aldolase [Actinomycetota bacterium]|nr:ketohydroxyglutarate aldolase [Actinomycetota bacterium]
MAIEIVISVDDENLGRLDDIAAALERMGVKVEHRMPSLGTISGVVDEAAIEGIRAVAGVEAVEVARTFQIPSPDSEVQ